MTLVLTLVFVPVLVLVVVLVYGSRDTTPDTFEGAAAEMVSRGFFEDGW